MELNNPASIIFESLLSWPNLDPTQLLIYLLLGMLRFGPIVALSPFLGSKVLPTPTRAGLALFFSITFLPLIISTATAPLSLTTGLIGISLKEVMIGFVLVYLSSIPFFIAQSSGIIVDFLRGSSQLMAQDPSTQNQVSSIGILYNYILIVSFYYMDGLFLFLDAVQTSYEFIPVNQVVPGRFFLLTEQPYLFFSEILGKLFALSIQLSAPCVLSILMAEFFLGIANRLAPQVQISFLGQSLKSLAGLFLLWAGWQFILKNMSNEAITFTKSINQLIENLIRISHAK